MKTLEEKDDHGKRQAKAQIESIIEMVNALETENDDERENAQEIIQNDPLSVEVRSGWHSVGSTHPPEEFCILLCWGGPACRIIGDLSEHAQMDRYTVRVRNEYYGMSENPNSPQGFNQFCGSYGEIKEGKHLGNLVYDTGKGNYKQLPAEVRQAITERT